MIWLITAIKMGRILRYTRCDFKGGGAGSRLLFQTGFQVQIADQPVEMIRMQTEQFSRFDIIVCATSLTTEPPMMGRRLGHSEDIDSGIRADLRGLYLYGRRLNILRSGVKNLEIRRLIVRRMGVGRIHFFCWMDELG
jgi:hypothetical protein